MIRLSAPQRWSVRAGIVGGLALLGAACQQTGGENGDVRLFAGGDSLFGSYARELEDLAKQQSFDKASQLYGEQKEYFWADVERRSRAVKVFAQELANKLAVPAQAAINDIAVIAWPAPRSEWARIKEKIVSAEGIAKNIASYDVMSDVRYRPAYLSHLDSLLSALRQRATDSAKDQFLEFRDAPQAEFFASYPVSLSIKGFLRDHKVALRQHFADATPAQVTALVEGVAGDLDDAAKNELGQLYYEAQLRGAGDGARRDLATIVAAIAQVRTRGLTLDSPPDTRISFVDATSPSLVREKQIEFAVGVDVDLPVSVVRSTLDSAFQLPEAREADVIVVMDVLAARNNRKIVNISKVQSK